MQNKPFKSQKFFLMFMLGISTILFLTQCDGCVKKVKVHKHVFKATEKTMMAPDSSIVNPFDPAIVGVGSIDGQPVYFLNSNITKELFNKKFFYIDQKNVDVSTGFLLAKKISSKERAEKAQNNFYNFVIPNPYGNEAPCSRTSRHSCIPNTHVDRIMIIQERNFWFTSVFVNMHPNHNTDTHEVTIVDSIKLIHVIFNTKEESEEYVEIISDKSKPCANIAVPEEFDTKELNGEIRECIIYNSTDFWIKE